MLPGILENVEKLRMEQWNTNTRLYMHRECPMHVLEATLLH